MASVLPLYRWSGPDEDARQAAVRYWKRAITLTAELGCTVKETETLANIVVQAHVPALNALREFAQRGDNRLLTRRHPRERHASR